MDCEWDVFDEWTSCSNICGGGKQSRIRSIKTQAENGGTSCTGDETEIQDCNTSPCPGLY